MMHIGRNKDWRESYKWQRTACYDILGSEGGDCLYHVLFDNTEQLTPIKLQSNLIQMIQEREINPQSPQEVSRPTQSSTIQTENHSRSQPNNTTGRGRPSTPPLPVRVGQPCHARLQITNNCPASCQASVPSMMCMPFARGATVTMLSSLTINICILNW